MAFARRFGVGVVVAAVALVGVALVVWPSAPTSVAGSPGAKESASETGPAVAAGSVDNVSPFSSLTPPAATKPSAAVAGQDLADVVAEGHTRAQRAAVRVPAAPAEPPQIVDASAAAAQTAAIAGPTVTDEQRVLGDAQASPQAASVYEALATNRYPERLTPMVVPAPFAAEKWQNDPAYREALLHQNHALFLSQGCENVALIPGSGAYLERCAQNGELIIATLGEREKVIEYEYLH